MLPLSYAMLASTRQLNEHQLGVISPEMVPSLEEHRMLGLGNLSPRRVQSQEVLLDETPQLTSPPVFASVGALRATFLPAKVRAWSRRILKTVGAGTRVKVVAAAHLCVGDGSRSPVVATHQTLVRRHPLVRVRLFRCSVAGALPGANRVDHRAAGRIEGVPHSEVAEELILRVNL